MKKMLAVIAIAVCFLMAGFGYSYAQQQPDMAGPLKSLNLNITYQQHIPPPNATHSGSESWITVPSSLNKVVKGAWKYDPTAHVAVDSTTGKLDGLWISWLDPNVNDTTNYGTRIVTIVCGGGNSTHANPTPGLGLSGASDPTDGSILFHPPLLLTAATETASFEGVLGCWVCPSGFVVNMSTTPPSIPSTAGTVCLDGSSWVTGYMTYNGTIKKDAATGYFTQINIAHATVSAGGFDYVGEAWAVKLDPKPPHLSKKDCIPHPNHPYCHAILTGTMSTKLTQCPLGSDFTNCP